MLLQPNPGENPLFPSPIPHSSSAPPASKTRLKAISWKTPQTGLRIRSAKKAGMLQPGGGGGGGDQRERRR